jgi:alkylhydroperoxidase/carboxymuconolactone decarboxylase family protein YurZ
LQEGDGVRVLAEGVPELVRAFDEMDERIYPFVCFARSIKNRSKPRLLKHFKGALEAGATLRGLAHIQALTFRESRLPARDAMAFTVEEGRWPG